MTLPHDDLASEMARAKFRRETDQVVREAFDANLIHDKSGSSEIQQHTARAVARDAATRPEPSREIPHMDRHFIELNKTTMRKEALADSMWLVWVGLVVAAAAFLWGLAA